jgi:ribosomal peptide maturation radical SAM protein 1
MIHLINMPFGSITHPNLALGLIKAQLEDAGLPTRVHNFNLTFAQRVNFGTYERIALFKGVETQVSEWLFAHEAWREPFGPSADEFLSQCGEELGSLPHIHDVSAWLRMVREQVVPQFLRDCVGKLLSCGDIKVVGFSCTFFQTVASLALGRLIREYRPDIKLVYGGACFHGEMGEELIAGTPWIDAVSTGEADDVIVPLFRAVSEGRPPAGLQSILYRHENQVVQAGPPSQPVGAKVLNGLPDPDFDDFFADANAVGLAGVEQWERLVFLPFEGSRGCWWGQKHHCTFCGLNAAGMGYRAKSADKVLRTLGSFVERYRSRVYRATDNILAVEYFKELLPVLAKKPFGDIEIFYEVKVNMTRAQVKALADASIVYIQPGIESLSGNLIKQMRKGMTALQNVFFMKCCREYGVMPNWNNLIRIPGETAEDYAHMSAWLPKLAHLWPPAGGSPKVEVHRFSPYFSEPGRWLERVRPSRWYAGLFPAERFDLARVAYYFDADWKDTLGDPAYDELVWAMLDWLKIWRESPELPQLTMYEQDDGTVRIVDTRGQQRREWCLDAMESRVYRAIDEPAKPGQLPMRLRSLPGPKVSVAEARNILDSFVARDLALTDAGSYIAIATMEQTPVVPYEFRRRQFAKQPMNQAPPRESAHERAS